MRYRLVLIAMGLAVVGSSLASPAGAKPVRLPRFTAGAWSGIKPSEIDFSGDGGNIVTHIRWRSWSHARAVGSGTSDILGCVPNCAEGTATPVSTRITFSKPRAGRFTKVVEIRAGHSFVAYRGHPAWPEGAS